METVSRVVMAVAATFALIVTLTTGWYPGRGSDPTRYVSDTAHYTITAEPVRPLSMSVVGDSISAWDPPFARNPAQSWVNTATSTVPLTGGWAYPGAYTSEMWAHTVRSNPYFLVIMAGTNDAYAGVPIAERIDTLQKIVHATNAQHVVISAVAPLGIAPQAGLDWNAALLEWATLRGYTFIDPWAPYRASDGTWAYGSLPDMVHPTPTTAAEIGASISNELVLLYQSQTNND